MKSPGSVVTYLIFEFLIPGCYFLLNIKHGASQYTIGGAARQIQP